MEAASNNRGSTDRTPKTVFSMIGKNAPRNTRKIAAFGPKPKKIMERGNQAVTGIGRSSEIVGSSICRRSLIRPIISPIGMPSAAASKKPPYTRSIDFCTWVRIVPLNASS